MFIVDDACGRYTLHQKTDDLAKRYNIATVPAHISENYNVAPGQIMPVVTAEASGTTQLQLMRWGYIPVWSKDPTIGYRLINARDDTIFDKPMWKTAILKHRCLIPADGFYEWKVANEPKDQKQPWYIKPKQLDIFSFAGVWGTWEDKATGEIVDTYSIVTTEPNQEMRPIHNRMPVILHPEDEAAWLDSSKVTREAVEPFLRPFEDRGLDMWPVGRDVNRAHNNDKSLIVPV